MCPMNKHAPQMSHMPIISHVDIGHLCEYIYLIRLNAINNVTMNTALHTLRITDICPLINMPTTLHIHVLALRLYSIRRPHNTADTIKKKPKTNCYF